ncbi:MAG TPA: RNA-guided endonuclease IscB [Bacteroidia bacterium]|nr:RNA-guided endonuclease IscB [Bacteroidia bacterium]
MVSVLSKKGEPLMPCECVVARLLLKSGKAKVISRMPFKIKLNYDATEYKQDLIHKMDTGSSFVGSAVSDNKNNVLYMAQVEIRNDVTEKMTQRSKYRRSRRNRKTRYRKCRFLNRKNSIKSDRFSPTMISKFGSHEKEINYVRKSFPITKSVYETATFDPHALKNPDVLKDLSLYQKGINFGFANTKAYVLHRDNYKCQNPKCKCKTKKPKLEVHHKLFKSNGGGDEEENLIVLCKQCHDGVHDGSVILKLTGKKKGQLKHATQMNSIRVQLLRKFPDAEETFGYITKEYRQQLGLPKEHYFDAVAIGSNGNPVKFKTNIVFLKKCCADGDYQLAKGVRSEQKINTGKIHGFRKFDKVKYNGKNYFIKGRMQTGYAILMDITGEKVDLKPIPKFEKMKRVSSRKTWMIDSKKINIETQG